MFRLQLLPAIVLATGLWNFAPASAEGAGLTRYPTWLSFRLAAAREPALRYTLLRWLLPESHVAKRTFASPWLTPPSTSEIVLHTFNGLDGEFPQKLIRDASGALYGTTFTGGGVSCMNGGCGTVFKLSPPSRGSAGWTYTTLHNFTGGVEGLSGGTDGAFPEGGLIADANGALYGTTSQGGSSTACDGGCGTIFKLTPPSPGHRAWTESVIHTFVGADGAYPEGSLTIFGGALFGVIGSVGATNDGAIVELTPPRPGSKTWDERIIHAFGSPSDGGSPGFDVLADHGALYATTFTGGTHHDGSIVKLTPPSTAGKAWTESIVHSLDGSDGIGLNDLLADPAGNIYGTTMSGGSGCKGGCGVAFELKRPANGGSAWTDQILYHFNGSTGSAPTSGLIADSLGNLYGVADAGGRGTGVVYKLTHSGGNTWSESTLHAFAGGTAGEYPYDNLVGDSYGNLYGVAGGGIGGSCQDYCGIVYEVAK